MANLSPGPARIGLNGAGYSSRMVTLRPGGPGRYAAALTAAGHEWQYQAEVPPSCDDQHPAPLVIVLHGAGLVGQQYLDEAGWADKASEAGFIVVAPDAVPSRPGHDPNFWLNPRVWNSGQQPIGSPRREVDDLIFFRALLDDIASRWPVDPDRVYVVGHSNGGAMALRLAVEMSDRFAAAASVAGLCWLADPKPSPPRPLLFIGGTEDPILPLEGGESVLPFQRRITPAVVDSLSELARRSMGCDDARRSVMADGVSAVRWEGNSGAEVSAVLLEGHGHSWPGADPFGPTHLMGPDRHRLNATDLVWDFFSRHSRGENAPVETAEDPAARRGAGL